MKSLRLLVLVPLLVAVSARAEVKRSAGYALVIEHKLATSASPADVFRALGQVQKWWDSRHTSSGSADNLSLKIEATGCFCESWSGGSVEHGRVVQVQKDRLLRLSAALGPLQELGVTGMLTFALEPAAETKTGTNLVVTYRVTGDLTHGLRSLAGAVDRVIGEQAARLARFSETGKSN